MNRVSSAANPGSGRRRRRRLLPFLTGINLVVLLLLWFSEAFVAERYWLTTLLVYAPQHLFGAPAVLLLLWALLRRDWISAGLNAAAVIFFGLALLGVNVPLRRGSPSGPRAATLRFMTYNIEHGAEGVERIAQVVRQVQPDLFCLQETSAFGSLPDPVPELHCLLPEWKAARHGEVATFSRYPILAQRVHPMPLKTGRVILATAVAVNGHRLTVLNVHLSTAATPETITHRSTSLPEYMRHTAAVRWEQVTTLLRVPGATAPLLIAGDFNTPPRGRLYQRMAHRFQDSFRAAGWGLGDTFPSGFPVLRIDYVFAGAGVTVTRCTVPNVAASDHRPTVTQLMLE